MPSDLLRVPPIAFRVPVALDFPALAEMRRDRRMQAMLMTIPERTDDEAVRQWIERRLTEPNGMFLAIAPDEQREAVGFVQISQVNIANGYGFGGIAVTDRCDIPGVALLAMRELMRFARVELGLGKLIAEIRADNAMAIRMNTLLGYKIVGTFEKHFVDHDNRRHDVLLLEKML